MSPLLLFTDISILPCSHTSYQDWVSSCGFISLHFLLPRSSSSRTMTHCRGHIKYLKNGKIWGNISGRILIKSDRMCARPSRDVFSGCELGMTHVTNFFSLFPTQIYLLLGEFVYLSNWFELQYLQPHSKVTLHSRRLDRLTLCTLRLYLLFSTSRRRHIKLVFLFPYVIPKFMKKTSI